MDIQDMKQDAAVTANEFPIDWDRMNDSLYRAEFVALLQEADRITEDLESMYVKMSSGKSVMLPEQDTPLPYDELERYRMLVGERLYESYVMREIYHRYQMVENIMKASIETP